MKVIWNCDETRFIPGVGMASPGAVLDMSDEDARKYLASNQVKPVNETKRKISDEGGEVK